MALWNPNWHKPTEYECIKLGALCKGKSGGSDAEWGWHGGKRRADERDTLSGSNVGVLAHAIKRHQAAIERLRTNGNAKEGVNYFDAEIGIGEVRQPETIVKVREGPPAGSPLALLAARCEGKEGDAEAEWCITRINGDDFVVFFSSIPSVVGRLIKRNTAAILKYTVHEYVEEGQFGVTLHLAVSETRHPTTLIKVG